MAELPEMSKLASMALKLYRSACLSVMPDSLVSETLKFASDSNRLIIRKHDSSNFDVWNEVLQVPLNRNLYVAAFGKAALGMATAVERICGTHIVRGIASIPKGTLAAFSQNANLRQTLPSTNSRIEFIEGAENNLPDAAAYGAALKVHEMASALTRTDVLLVLVSGGGSALLPAPISGVSLSQKQDLLRTLSKRGADIEALNSVRQQLSELKNGKLAALAFPAQVIALIMSDIIGNPLHLIASGPTVISQFSNSATALEILRKYGIDENDAPAIFAALKRDVPVAKASPPDRGVFNVLIGDNMIALRAAQRLASTASDLSCEALIASDSIQGDANAVASELANLTFDILNHLQKCRVSQQFDLTFLSDGAYDKIITLPKARSDFDKALSNACVQRKPFCLLFGGETTVNVHGSGKGGRCQHLTLAYSMHVYQRLQDDKQLPTPCDNSAVFLCAGSDGQDGPTDAAGAWIEPFKLSEWHMSEIEEELSNSNSYQFWARRGENLLKTGLTGTNVMDIMILLVDPSRVVSR